MSESKFIQGDPVKLIAPGKYGTLEEGTPGMVEDVYLSKRSGEFVYEVHFNGRLWLVREADIELR